MNAGRPKLEPDLEHVKQLAARGLSRDQIAAALGISRDTVFRRLKDSATFATLIKEGEALGLKAVSNALFEAALNGNVTAMIFFLKCRASEQWNDKQAVAVEAKHTFATQVETDRAH